MTLGAQHQCVVPPVLLNFDPESVGVQVSLVYSESEYLVYPIVVVAAFVMVQ